MNANAPAPPLQRLRTCVYIDGFNLYYGALRKTSFRWLDLDAFCRLLLPKNDIRKIKYFTARVTARPGKPDTAVRQQTYLRALGTLANVEVYFGHYLSHVRRLPLAAPGGGVLRDASGKVLFADVLREEEKGSDVNLAAHLIHDAHCGEFDVGVVITNDSDLATPIELVTRDLGLPCGRGQSARTESWRPPIQAASEGGELSERGASRWLAEDAVSLCSCRCGRPVHQASDMVTAESAETQRRGRKLGVLSPRLCASA